MKTTKFSLYGYPMHEFGSKVAPKWFPVTYYSLRTTHCSLFTTSYSLLSTLYSLLTTQYSLLTTHNSCLIMHYSLFDTRYSGPDVTYIDSAEEPRYLAARRCFTVIL